MRIEEKNENGVLLLAVKDNRIDARNAADISARIRAAIQDGSRWIVLDLAPVEFVDSSGLGAIVSALKLLGDQGDLLISGAQEPIRALFRLTRMDKVFRMYEDLDEARRVAADDAANVS